MGFAKEKTVEVCAEDFLRDDLVCHAEFEHGGKRYVVQVVRDRDVENPRLYFDHAWTWATTRGAGYSDKGAMSLSAWDDMDKEEREQYLCYPLGLYRHGGDHVYVGGGAYLDAWDSGQMGVAYITKEEALAAFGGRGKIGESFKPAKRLTKQVREKALAGLKSEVEEMNCFLHGDVYGVIVTDFDLEDDESCWGFYCADDKEIGACVMDMLPGDMTKEAKQSVVNNLV
jgi:hypothetical protein